MSAERWLLVDILGRNMGGFRTRGAARRWLADVGTSNPPAVAGWRVVNAKDYRPVDQPAAQVVNVFNISGTTDPEQLASDVARKMARSPSVA